MALVQKKRAAEAALWGELFRRLEPTKWTSSNFMTK